MNTNAFPRHAFSPVPSFLLFRSVALLISLASLTAVDRVAGAEPESVADSQSAAQAAAEPVTDPAIYGQGVRETEWRSPEDERQGFHLPPGFEIRCFASEPQIAKPLNLAFDDHGRMWVTHSVEYPYPAKEAGQPRDAISVLRDTDGDGSADEVTRFADKLNIPIGVLPYGDGCLCFSIPNIWYLRDTDGDGKCDEREVVLGPFDTSRDTHGMVNAMRDGGDGWIYACHGFNNQSQVAGTDGHEVQLHSGNTFRFRPDGSRIEHVTHGQVNPFGMTQDHWGYWYTADCHSRPITQLVRGAYYSSFGRPHDGLGFLPPMMEHLHGSTAISGIQFVHPESAIKPLRGQFISGNVMTSRLNRNRLRYEGTTAQGEELGDFMTSDDPWFRPVDIRLGPDGHLYVADFYNKIIGHYEVPLDHPGRDRNSGRIWQIRYTGGAADPDPPVGLDQAAEIAVDASQSDHRRIEALRTLVTEGDQSVTSLPDIFGTDSPRVHLEALRLAAEQTGGGTDVLKRAETALQSQNPHLQRMAAEILGRFGAAGTIEPLRKLLSTIPGVDVVRRQTVRIALRDLLQRLPSDAPFWSEPADSEFASILLGLKRPEAARTLLNYLRENPTDPRRDEYLAHAASHADSTVLEQAVRVSRHLTGPDSTQAWQLLKVLADSQRVSGRDTPQPLRDWASALVEYELASLDPEQPVVAWVSDDGKPWPEETRTISAGGERSLTSSLGRGEQYTGRLVSDVFEAPAKISFWLAGHNGFPREPDHGKNRVRLLHGETGQLLAEATPPRNDTAKRVVWNTTDLSGADVQGQSVRLEVIDGDGGNAYAWLALGDFEPAWIQQSTSATSLQRALEWISRLKLDSFRPELEQLLKREHWSGRLRAKIAGTVAALDDNAEAQVVMQFLQRSNAPTGLVDQAVAALLQNDAKAWDESLRLLGKRLSADQQREFASVWAGEGGSLAQLFDIAERGWISPDVFVDSTVKQTLEPRLNDPLSRRLQQITSAVDIDNEAMERLARLQNSVDVTSGDPVRGAELYKKHCAACHQLRGAGAVVGPQLDGAVTRSTDRLLEDVVLPDRNVDQAFRTTSLLLQDGRVLVGLIVAEDGNRITIVAQDGQKSEIDSAMVERRKLSQRSLMPSNMSELLDQRDFEDLIRFIRRG